MTIRPPCKAYFDRVLSWFGMERGIDVPDDLQPLWEKFGPYSDIRLKWKSWIKRLFNR